MDRVVVVGAGPVGVAAALLLARLGVPSLVLDRYEDPYPLPRAVHVDDEVVRILQAVGVADEFLAVSRPGLGLRLLDGRHRVMAEFRRSTEPGPHGYPQANMFDQPDLERLLRARMAAEPLIEFVGGAEVFAVSSTLVRYRRRSDNGEESVPASAVLGCDGANSTVRDLIGATLVDLHFEERWLVVDGVCEPGLDAWGGVHQVCDPRRAATFMQLGPQRYRWEFRLFPGETDPEPAALLTPWLRGVPVQIVRQAQYTFRANIADRWRRDRVFLLGDAAHQTPPFIGQGLGAGLRDAYNLCWKLATAADLDSYERERAPHVRAQIRLAKIAGWAMTGGQDRAAAVRRLVLGSIWRLPGLKSAALRSTSPKLTTLGRGLPGTLAPQPPVVWEGHEMPLDEALGPDWATLFPNRLPQRYRGRLIKVTPTLDPTGALRGWLRGRTVILRPDRVVHAAFH